jgi:hypothetical protein
MNTSPTSETTAAKGFRAWWREQWRHWWFKALVSAVGGWLLLTLPAGVQRGVDAYRGSVVVSVSGSNHGPHPIDFFQVRTLRGTSAGAGSMNGKKPGADWPSYSGLACCRELQLRYDEKVLVRWRFDVSVAEAAQGIRPPPAREAIVPIEIVSASREEITDLHVHFYENDEVAVTLGDLRGAEAPATGRTPSHLAPPGFDRGPAP